MKKLLLILLTATLFLGCDKFDEEAVLTPGEKAGRDIMEIAEANKITVVDVFIWFENAGFQNNHTNAKFIVDGQFLIVSSNYYNLNYLHTVKVLEVEGNKYLKLYFESY